jgi:hypothetical protein
MADSLSGLLSIGVLHVILIESTLFLIRICEKRYSGLDLEKTQEDREVLKMSLAVVRADLLRDLMKDDAYARRLKQANTWLECVEVIREFAKEKGYKFAEIYEGKK